MLQLTRVMAIVHLCLTFSVILGLFSTPFTEEYLSFRSRLLLYEYLMHSPQHQNRFQALPASQQEALSSAYASLSKYAQRPVMEKVVDGMKKLFCHTPLFQQAWFCFSFILAICVLKRREGIAQAIWILPLLTCAYGIETHSLCKSHEPREEYSLFPSEEMLIQNYRGAPLSASLSLQKQELEDAWHAYLIAEWTDQQVNKEEALDSGFFNFTLARLLHQTHEDRSPLSSPPSQITILVYFVWNCLLALSCSFSPQQSQIVNWKTMIPTT